MTTSPTEKLGRAEMPHCETMTLKIAIVVLVCLAAGVGTNASEVAASQPSEVARVGARAIFAQDVLPDERKVEDQFWLQHHRAPDARTDFAELASLRLKVEMQRLDETVHLEVAEQLAARYGVTVSPNEIKSFCEANLSDGQARSMQLLLAEEMKAVEEVYVGHQGSDDVFNRGLLGKMSKEQWEHLLFGWRSAEWRKEVKENIGKSPAAFRETIEAETFRPLARRSILRDRLSRIADGEISKEDLKYASISAAIHARRGVRQEGAEDPVIYYTHTQSEWWTKKARSIGVQIFDPRFSEVGEHILKEGEYGAP